MTTHLFAAPERPGSPIWRDIGGSLFNVLVVTPWFPNGRAGWPGRFIADSAVALAQAGATVSVCVFRAWYPSVLARWAPPPHRGEVNSDEFPELNSLASARYVSFPAGLARRIGNLLLDWQVKRVLQRQIALCRPDVVHVHTEQLAPAVMAIAARFRLPVVTTLHGEHTNAAYIGTLPQRERFRRALARVDRLVVVGAPLLPYAARLAGRSDHIQVVWNGVDAPAATPRSTAGEGPLRFVTVANLHQEKGVGLLLAALARIDRGEAKNWTLRIIGEGPQHDELAEFVSREGLAGRVSFLGTVSNSTVLDVLQDSDVFVLPSYREAFGMAYLEAMSCGLLTVGVRGQGPSEFIEDGRTGLLVEPDDLESLVSCIGWILRSGRNRWGHIAAAGMEHVRRHMSWGVHARRLMGVLSSAAGVASPLHSRDASATPRSGGPAALALFVEPAPYIVRLAEELSKRWHGPTKILYLGRRRSQAWSPAPVGEVLPANLARAVHAIWERLRETKAQVVYVPGWGNAEVVATILMARMLNLAVVASSDTWRSPSSPLRAWVKKLLFRSISVFSPGGLRQARYLNAMGIPVEKIAASNMTVDVRAMMEFHASAGSRERDRVRAALGMAPQDVMFLFVGRLAPEKGVDLLIPAFSALVAAHARLVIVGDGSDRTSLEGEARSSSRITFVGRKEGRDLWSFYAAADIFVAPSRHEPWGLVANEAMAAGLALVVSDSFGCIEDLVHSGENALVTPTGDTEALRDAMQRLVSHPELRAHLGAAALQTVRHWTIEKQAENITRAWSTAIEASTPPGRQQVISSEIVE